jgi:hypothetical protein
MMDTLYHLLKVENGAYIVGNQKMNNLITAWHGLQFQNR